MTQGITITPQQMTNAANTFRVSSYGGFQGMFVDDPAIRNELISAVVAPTVSVPISGGYGITESLPTAGQEVDSVGSVIALATAETNLTGFTVFNQSHALINSPQSPVPLASPGNGSTGPGGFISIFRLGSGARIWVACSSTVATALAGAAINTAVYWDYTNQLLLSSPGGTALPGVKILKVDTVGRSQVIQSVASINSTGLGTWNYSGYAAMIQI
jgi:hypothetical protein